MQTDIHYIEEKHIQTYLKLGRQLVQFVKWDRFFGRPTFDWIRLETCKDVFRATLIRSLDEGSAFFSDVYTFPTLNESQEAFDELENPFYTGHWEEVWNWMRQYPVDAGQFVRYEDLRRIYLLQKKIANNY